jgi:hypothetical protein
VIRVGQALAGDPSPWTHTFIAVDTGRVLQAMPWGAEIVPVERFCRPDVVWLHGWHPLTVGQQERLPGVAERLVGTRYGFLDYLSLILAAMHVRPAWLRRYMASNRSLICSQLIDVVMQEMGEQLFTDGRIPADVTPGDILRQAVIDHSRIGCTT